MAAFLDSTVREIDSRLRELRDEMSKLEAARAALAGNGSARRRGAAPAQQRASVTATSTTGAPSARLARRRRATARRGRGRAPRAAQALAIVRDQPGITIPGIAKAMKMEPNYLYRVMPRLAREGQVKRDRDGWHPAS